METFLIIILVFIVFALWRIYRICKNNSTKIDEIKEEMLTKKSFESPTETFSRIMGDDYKN